jgi:hypothetical protein
MQQLALVANKLRVGSFFAVFQRLFVKIQITSQIIIVKGLNTVSHAWSMNHKQLMSMHLWNGR